MSEYFRIEVVHFSYFIALNWLCTILAACWLLSLYRRQRFLFVKPSIQLLTYSHIFFQWPLAFYAGYYQIFLPDPYALFFIVHGYEFVGLLIASQTMRRAAKDVWIKVTADGSDLTGGASAQTALMLLTGLLVAGIGIYLLYVPFSSTGLYALFADPEHSAMARENSLKLLENPIPKFAYSFATSSIAPLLAAMLVAQVILSLAGRHWWRVAISVIAFAGVMFVVSLTGARSGPVYMLILAALVWLWRKRLALPFWGGAVAIAGIIAVAIFMTLLREGRGVGDALDLVSSLLFRAFAVPIEVGAWYVDYAQLNDLFGIAAIPKLAVLFGVEPINASNIIGMQYAFQPLPSISATAGYLLTYYSYFGPSALVIALVGLMALDVAVLVMTRLATPLFLPCLAAISLATLMFIQSDYTVVWFTHGFGLILLVAIMVSTLSRYAHSVSST
jgi:hypothetical protein